MPRFDQAHTPWRRAAILLVPLMLAITLAEPRLRHRFGPITTQILVFGGLLISVASAFLIFGLHRRDPVIGRAVRTARAGNWQEGVTRLREAIASNPTAERCAALGALLGQRKLWIEAASAFAQAYQLEPANPIHLMSQCVMLISGGQRESASTLIDQARQAAPHESALAYAQAIVLAESGSMKQAVTTFHEAQALDREHPENQKTARVSRATLLKLCRERLGLANRS